MKILPFVVAALAAGCGSTLGTPDGGGGVCRYDGVVRPPGTSFPAGDSCNRCSCTASGEIACTLIPCRVDSGLDDCALDATYHYGETGGLVAYVNQAILSPPGDYRYIRSAVGIEDPPSMSCAPSLPACLSTDAIDVNDIVRDIRDPDVQSALALTTPPVYGRDPRAFDGTIFQFLRGDGHGFLAGYACSGTSGCVDAPAGVSQLVAGLRDLDTQQLQDPSCTSLR